MVGWPWTCVSPTLLQLSQPLHKARAQGPGWRETTRCQKLTETDNTVNTVTLDNKLWLSTPQSDCKHHGVTGNTKMWLSSPLSESQHLSMTVNTKLWLLTPMYDYQHKVVTVNTTMWKSTPHCDCQHHCVTDNPTLWLLPPHCDCDWRNTVWLSTAVRSTIMIQTARGPLAFMACLLSDSFLKFQIQGLALLGPRVSECLDKSTKQQPCSALQYHRPGQWSDHQCPISCPHHKFFPTG